MIEPVSAAALASFLAASFAGGAAAWVRRAAKHHAPPRADEVLEARTGDGWRIAVHRWRPRGSARRGDPVFLCHGLAATASTWDLGGREASLARYLATRGHDVFALDLRGAGESERPGLLSRRRYDWGVHGYLTRDVPAAIERVLAATGRDRVHWVGHSMGGILLLALAPGPLRERLATGTTIASSLDYTVGSDFGKLNQLGALLRLLPVVPLGSMARAYAPIAGFTYFDHFMFVPASFTVDERRALWASAFTWIPTRVLSDLATTFEPGGFRGRDGVRWLEAARQIETPFLMIGGTRDLQCPDVAARATFDLLGSREKRYRVFEGLGHFDLAYGARAAREVFPEIASWIEGEDGERVAGLAEAATGTRGGV